MIAPCSTTQSLLSLLSRLSKFLSIETLRTRLSISRKMLCKTDLSRSCMKSVSHSKSRKDDAIREEWAKDESAT